MFSCASLNSTIIFKMPNFEISEMASAEIGEWDLAAQLKKVPDFFQAPIETGIYIPYSPLNRAAGGVVLYVRQRNFETLMREFLGINYKDTEGPTKRDRDILARIDEIPSLDPFLLKMSLGRPFPDIDDIYYDISEAEEASVRNTISTKVVPIVRKAVEGKSDSPASLEKFVNAIWNPSAPEASLFVSAFGISQTETQDTFEAWRGIAFYEWSFRRIVMPISRLLSWLGGELSTPLDAQRLSSAQKNALNKQRISIGQRISACARETEVFFKDYEGRHVEFLEKNDPRRFREFLCNAKKSYWRLGWSTASLIHVIAIFTSSIRRSTENRLSAETLTDMYRQMEISLKDNLSKPISDPVST